MAAELEKWRFSSETSPSSRRLKLQKKTPIKLFGELLEIHQETLNPKSWVLLTSLQAFYEHGQEVVCGAIGSVRNRASKIALWLSTAKAWTFSMMALGHYIA